MEIVDDKLPTMKHGTSDSTIFLILRSLFKKGMVSGVNRKC